MILRCSRAPKITSALVNHVISRQGGRFDRRGSACRTFVVLDEEFVLRQIYSYCTTEPVQRFLYNCLGNDVYCVSAQLLKASKHAKQQVVHRDHPHGFRKYATLVFTIDGRMVDTLIEQNGTLCPANCSALIYDSHYPHAGPAGPSENKIFVGFSNPSLPSYRSIARQNGHGKKKQYAKLPITARAISKAEGNLASS